MTCEASLVVGEGVADDTGHPMPLSQESNIPEGGRGEASRGGWRRRRPNRRVRPVRGDRGLANMMAPHHSVHVQERRKCRVCHKRMKWICPRCNGWSICSGHCFLEFHRINEHNI
jgi:hypothetical protein